MKTEVQDETGIEDLQLRPGDLRDAVHVREIISALEQTRLADAQLRRAVHAAREAGDSWTVIGMALGVTRQAAQKRFAHAGRLPNRDRPSGAQGTGVE